MNLSILFPMWEKGGIFYGLHRSIQGTYHVFFQWFLQSRHTYMCRVSAIRFSAAGSLPPCFPLTGSWKLLIVTTNLTLEELQHPEDTAHARIYDRLLEMCCPLFFTGENIRKSTAQRKMEQLKELMNGKESLRTMTRTV